MEQQTLQTLLQSIARGELMILAGAGLSRPNDCVPSAWTLAQKAIEKHRQESPEDLSPLLDEKDALGAVASHFYPTELYTYFIPHLVDWTPFFGEPNAGHDAIADFLCCGAVDGCLTTNFDVLVENSALRLGARDFRSALNGYEARRSRWHRPYLKLHGCARLADLKTLWCREQLEEDYWKESLSKSANWIRGLLMNRDVLIIGFWTDWAYLNEALVATVSDQVPRSVIVVDPQSETELQDKAPDLWAWASSAPGGLIHEPESSDRFLGDLRYAYSEVFIRKTLGMGERVFYSRHGGAPPTVDLSTSTVNVLYDIRRDLSGTPRHRPVAVNSPSPSWSQTGCFTLELIKQGATLDGPEYVLSDRRIRVLHAPGRSMSELLESFRGESTALGDEDLVVCVGAWDEGGVPFHLIDADEGPTVVRDGPAGKWITAEQATELVFSPGDAA